MHIIATSNLYNATNTPLKCSCCKGCYQLPLCFLCVQKCLQQLSLSSLSSQQAQASRKTNCHPKIDFLWLSHHCLPLFVSVYDSKVDHNKISNKPLSIEEGEPMEFSPIRIGTSLTSKDLKSSALPDMLAILVLCEGNAWQHGQYMPPWTTAFLRIYNACVVSVIQTIFYHTWNASRQVARMGSSRCWSHM